MNKYAHINKDRYALTLPKKASYCFRWQPSNTVLGAFAFIALNCIALPSYSIAEEKINSIKSDDSIESDSLQKQLAKAIRELHEYKSQIFRPSHPNDLQKIKELKLQLSEQSMLIEKLKSQLETLDKEYMQSRKQSTNLEITTDALSAFIQTQRLVVDAQKNNFENQKDLLLATLEKTKQVLSKNIEDYKTELEKLKEDYSHLLLEEIQLIKLEYDSTQLTLNSQINELVKEVEFRRQKQDDLSNELKTSRQIVLTQEQRVNELEKIQIDAMTYASFLTDQLNLAKNQYDETQNELISSLQMLEEAKTFLLTELHESNIKNEEKNRNIQTLEQELAEAIARLESQKQFTNALEIDLEDSLKDNSMLKFALSETLELAHETQKKFLDSLAALSEEQEKYSFINEQNSNILNHLTSSIDYLQALQLAYDNLKVAFDELNDDIFSHKALISEISHDNLHLQAENTTLNIKTSDLLSQQELIKQQIASVNYEKEQALSSSLALALLFYQDILKDFHHQREQLEEKLIQKEYEYKELQAHIHDQNNKYFALNNSHQELHNLHQSLSIEKNKLEESLFNLSNQFEQRHQQALAQAEKLNYLEQANIELDRSLALSDENQLNLQKTIQKLESQHANQEAVFKSVQASLLLTVDTLESQNALAEEKLKQHEYALLQLQNLFNGEKNELQTLIQEQHSKYCDLNKDHEELSRTVATLNLEKNKLVQSLNDLTDQFQKRNQELYTLVEKLKTLEELNIQLTDSLSFSKSSHQNLQGHIQKLETHLFNKETLFNAEKNDLAASVDALHSKIEQNFISIQNLTEQLDEALHAQQKGNTREKELHAHIQSLTELAENQDQALIHANYTVNKAQSLYSQLQNENKQLKNHLNFLETEIRESKARAQNSQINQQNGLKLPAITLLLKTASEHD